MLIFPSRDQNSALGSAEGAGAGAQPHPTEPGEHGRVLRWRWDGAVMGQALTVRGICVDAA